MPAFKDFTGQRFGKLLVVSRTPSRGKGGLWNVKCDCGTEKVVASVRLATGLKSCGCAIAEANSRRAKHGATAGKRGQRVTTKAYQVWRGVKDRCLNPNALHYHRYGGRGVTMHPAWVDDFAQFLADVGEPPSSDLTLDRVDNNGNYEPGNVRWATRKEQANNRDTNIKVTHKGVTRSLADWGRELGVSYPTLRARWVKGVRGPEELLAPQRWVRGEDRIEFNGVVKPLHQWAKETGISYHTLRWRYLNNKPLL